MEIYSSSRKSRRWWMRLFYYFLDASIVNSYIIHREISQKNKQKSLSPLMFRSILVDELIGSFCQRTVLSHTGIHPKKQSSRFEGPHMPTEIKNRHRCARCSIKNIEKRSSVVCRKCDVGLCINCFTPFHESK